MKRTNNKRLAIPRETVRRLSTAQMADVGGGVDTSHTGLPSCDPTCCPSCYGCA